MHAMWTFLKKEYSPILLVLFSLLPLFFIGSLLDILLIHFFSRVQDGGTMLPPLSKWVIGEIAGYRFLSQEIMIGFWGLLALSLLICALTSKSRDDFRVRFLHSFLWGWIISLGAASFLGLACALPFDLMLDRLDGISPVGRIIHIALLVELLLLVVVPIAWARRRKRQHKGEA